MSTPKPGTVLAVRTGGWAGTMIRLGAAIRGNPNLSNHIAVVHHTDAKSTTWALEGRPNGVGWRDTRDYLSSKWTLTNSAQPLTPDQSAAVCKTMEAMIGVDYDWSAIVADAGHAFGLDTAWLPDFKTGQIPGAVVCSSLAAYAYSKNGLAHPAGPDRAITPADWDSFILTRGWETSHG